VTARVSVIIPHFNRSDLLQQAVASTLLSNYRDFEIIVVDDGSSPEEWSRIKSLESDRVRVLRRKGGMKGPSRCRNEGASESTGNFLLFLDSDDLLAPWCVSERVSAAAAEPVADCWVFPVLLFEEEPGDTNVLWNRLDLVSDDGMRFIRADPPWHTSSPLWKKSAFTALGGFNERLIYGDDSDLHLRAIIEGHRIRKFPDAVPDAFVRRSSAPRITNTLDAGTIASRLTRLSAGARLLTNARNKAYSDAWEGQYFMEGEFLLFNVANPAKAVSDLLETWVRDYPRPNFRRTLARAYFSVVLRSQDHAYFVVRLARRALMLLLPAEYFPSRGEFENALASPGSMRILRDRLRDVAFTVSE
jgi:hypothetical protein